MELDDRQALVSSSAGAGSGAWTPKFRLLYETAPVGLAFLTPDCRYRLINPVICAKFAAFLSMIVLGGIEGPQVPQVAEQVENIVQTILRTGNSITGIEVGQRPDGGNADRVWITNWHPLIARDGSILGINVASEDITERKRMEAALAASERVSRTRQQFAQFE